MEKKWQYLGVFLTLESKENLLSKVIHYVPKNSWRIIAEHMTVVFNKGGEYYENILNQYEERLGDTIELKVVGIGISEEAIAVQVVDPTESVSSTNHIAHITVAVAPGCKPVRSNFIEDWKPIDNFMLEGKLELR